MLDWISHLTTAIKSIVISVAITIGLISVSPVNVPVQAPIREKIEQSVDSRAVNIQTETSIQNKVVQDTTVELQNLNSYIDVLIASYEENITYAKEILESVDFYDDNFKKGSDYVSVILNLAEKTPYKYWTDIRGWNLVKTDGFDKSLKYNGGIRRAALANIKNMEDSIATLKKEKEKNLLSEPVNVEYYWAYYDELEKFLNNANDYKATLAKTYDTFVSETKRSQSDIKSVMQLISIKEDAYYSSLKDMYDSASNRVAPIYQTNFYDYQPIVYPTIKMPQTTRCTTRGLLGGDLEINCTTSIF